MSRTNAGVVYINVFLMFILSLTSTACLDQAPINLDGSQNLDGSRPTDTTQHDVSSANGKDWVFSRIVMPDTTTAAVIGRDYSGDGNVDNALGSILGALSGITTNLSNQGAINASINQGQTLILMRTNAASYASDPKAGATIWIARPQACCTSVTNPPACASEAKLSCFAGGHTFKPDPADPAGSRLTGPIKGGNALLGPATVKITLPLIGPASVPWTLKAAYLKGTFTGATITNGVLSGAIPVADLQSKLVPAISVMLNSTLKDPGVDKTTKDTIKTLFDANKDGVITALEAGNNALIKTFLSGDVDVDGDGIMELSLGLSYDAVAATIVP